MICVFALLQGLLTLIRDITRLIFCWAAVFLTSKHKLAAKVITLHSQLALYQLQQEKGIIPKPKCTPCFRLTWILLKQFFIGWQDTLCIVKPETVIRWHRASFQMYWRYKSRPENGRPIISDEMRRLIRKVSADNPLWSPDLTYKHKNPYGWTFCKVQGQECHEHWCH